MRMVVGRSTESALRARFSGSGLLASGYKTSRARHLAVRTLIVLGPLLTVVSPLDAQAPEGWITTYHGGTGDGLEAPVGIAVDTEGAVYVSGSSGRGVTSLKYDAGGTLLWSAHSGGGYAVAMALDSSGNLFAGKRTSNGSAIVQYDSAGNERAVANLNGGNTRASDGELTEVPDSWVRIRRQGSEFIGSSSIDGNEWLDLGRVSLDLPEAIFVGFAASARVGLTRQAVPSISVTFDHLALALEPPSPDRRFQRGDANADGDVNLTDATVILGALFGGQADTVTCEKSADSNDSGALEISDSVYLLAHLFQAGPAPAEPFGACGGDPTADSLSCVFHEACD